MPKDKTALAKQVVSLYKKRKITNFETAGNMLAQLKNPKLKPAKLLKIKVSCQKLRHKKITYNIDKVSWDKFSYGAHDVGEAKKRHDKEVADATATPTAKKKDTLKDADNNKEAMTY